MDHGAILNTLLLELKDGVIVCDAGGTILRFNEAAADLFDHDQRLVT
ncbi:MAG: PAS domain-containing protein, partial [Desulfobulbales bacterium]